VWALDEALPVETAAEAAEALKSAPPSLSATDAGHAGVYAGRALLLAGRVDEALTFLRVSSSSCLALNDPFSHTRSRLWLGQALEQKGDTLGACEAYAGVLERWGQAKPKSVTAEAARKRMDALKCGK
jgi:serine/threonine-protein kinase